MAKSLRIQRQKEANVLAQLVKDKAYVVEGNNLRIDEEKRIKEALQKAYNERIGGLVKTLTTDNGNLAMEQYCKRHLVGEGCTIPRLGGYAGKCGIEKSVGCNHSGSRTSWDKLTPQNKRNIAGVLVEEGILKLYK